MYIILSVLYFPIPVLHKQSFCTAFKLLTISWNQVALKTLIVIHRALREVDPTFQEELLNYGRSKSHMLNMAHFKDDSGPNGNLSHFSCSCSLSFRKGKVSQNNTFFLVICSSAWDYSAWVRTYALFLEERLECFHVLKYDVETDRPVHFLLSFLLSFSLGHVNATCWYPVEFAARLRIFSLLRVLTCTWVQLLLQILRMKKKHYGATKMSTFWFLILSQRCYNVVKWSADSLISVTFHLTKNDLLCNCRV